VATHQILECCHAVHHVSGVLAFKGRTQSALPRVTERCSAMASGVGWSKSFQPLQHEVAPIAELETEISYLRRHGEAGRLSYVSFRKQGLP
jgi:hypothetical protein